MPRIHVAKTVFESKKHVRSVLFAPNAVVGAVIRGVDLDAISGALYVIAFATTDGDVYVFDLRTEPDILITGQVIRVLQSSDITKVFHDCADVERFMKQKHGVILRNYIETQVEYEKILERECLPPRTIELHELCYKFFITELFTPSERLQLLLAQDRNVWARRPFDRDMLLALASDAVTLPVLYFRMSSLRSGHTDVIANTEGSLSEPSRPAEEQDRDRRIVLPMVAMPVNPASSDDSNEVYDDDKEFHFCCHGQEASTIECECMLHRDSTSYPLRDSMSYPLEPFRPAEPAYNHLKF